MDPHGPFVAFPRPWLTVLALAEVQGPLVPVAEGTRINGLQFEGLSTWLSRYGSRIRQDKGTDRVRK